MNNEQKNSHAYYPESKSSNLELISQMYNAIRIMRNAFKSSFLFVGEMRILCVISQ